jgi:methyl-accepting chemotaxis protein
VRIIHKFFAAAGVFLLGATVVVGLTYAALNKAEADVTVLAERDLPANELLLNIDRDAYQAQLALERYLVADGTDEPAAALDDFTSNAAQTEERFLSYEEVAVGAEGEAAEGDAYWADRATWLESADALIGLRDQGLTREDPQVEALAAETAVMFDAMRDHLDVLYTDIYEARAGEFGPATVAHLQATSQRMLVLLVVTVLIGSAIVYWIGRRVRRPLGLVTSAARAIASGDTSQEITHTSRDETGDLADAFRDMTDYLREAADTAAAVAAGDLTATFTPRSEADQLGAALAAMIASLRDVVGSAAAVTRQVDDGSEVLAQSSEESARAATEVATSINSVADGTSTQAEIAEGLAAAVSRIIDEIKAATDAFAAVAAVTTDAEEKATDGADRITQAATAMSRITASFADAAKTVAELGEHSERVEEIVDLIRSIADQTNLLALNAAIEAARAGELGRGFAVVASEVKSLAEESSQSTEQIAGIVAQMRESVASAVSAMETGRAEVDSGTAVVTAAGESFESINAAVSTISAKVQVAAESTNQIHTATDAIDSGAGRLLELTETASAASAQVAASSEEAAATSEEIGATAQELAASAKSLNTAMSRFRL